MLFSIETRPSIKEQNPDMKMCDISKELGKMWKEYTDEEKQPWVEKHEQEKAQLESSNSNPAQPPTSPTTSSPLHPQPHPQLPTTSPQNLN